MADGWRFVARGRVLRVGVRAHEDVGEWQAEATVSPFVAPSVGRGTGATEAAATEAAVGDLAASLLTHGEAVREVVPPGAMTQAEATAAMKERCVQACQALIEETRHDDDAVVAGGRVLARYVLRRAVAALRAVGEVPNG